MSKYLSAKYYHKHKERPQKKLVKDRNIFLRKKKKKSDNMVLNVTKISQKMKIQSSLGIQKKHYRMTESA